MATRKRRRASARPASGERDEQLRAGDRGTSTRSEPRRKRKTSTKVGAGTTRSATKKAKKAKKAPAKRAPAKTSAKRAPAKTSAKKAPAKKVPAKRTPAKTSAKRAPAKKAVAKTSAKRSPAKKVPAKTLAKKALTRVERAEALERQRRAKLAAERRAAKRATEEAAEREAERARKKKAKKAAERRAAEKAAEEEAERARKKKAKKAAARRAAKKAEQEAAERAAKLEEERLAALEDERRERRRERARERREKERAEALAKVEAERQKQIRKKRKERQIPEGMVPFGEVVPPSLRAPVSKTDTERAASRMREIMDFVKSMIRSLRGFPGVNVETVENEADGRVVSQLSVTIPREKTAEQIRQLILDMNDDYHSALGLKGNPAQFVNAGFQLYPEAQERRKDPTKPYRKYGGALLLMLSYKPKNQKKTQKRQYPGMDGRFAALLTVLDNIEEAHKILPCGVMLRMQWSADGLPHFRQ